LQNFSLALGLNGNYVGAEAKRSKVQHSHAHTMKFMHLVFFWAVSSLYLPRAASGSNCRRVTVGEIPRVSFENLFQPTNWKYASGQAAYILTELPNELRNILQWDAASLRNQFAPYDVGVYWRNMRTAGPNMLRTTTMANAIDSIVSSDAPRYVFWAGMPATPAAQLFPRMPRSMPSGFTDAFEPWDVCFGNEMFKFEFDFKSKWRLALIGKSGNGQRSLQPAG